MDCKDQLCLVTVLRVFRLGCTIKIDTPDGSFIQKDIIVPYPYVSVGNTFSGTLDGARVANWRRVGGVVDVVGIARSRGAA